MNDTSKMKYYLSAGLRAGAFSLVSSILVMVLMENQSSVRVPGEPFAIFFWSLPFAFGLAIAAALVIRFLFSRFTRLLTYPLAILLGIAAGIFWEMTVYSVFINPYFGTFSIPVIIVWIAGGISGMVAIAGVGSRTRKSNLMIELLLVGAVCLSIGLGSDDLINRVFEQRQVNTVWIRWYPGTERLSIDNRLSQYLTIEEHARLRELVLSGYLEWVMTSSRERGPISRMVIVMQQPVEGEDELHLPAEQGVIYLCLFINQN